VQNPAIPLALWIESSMSVSRARARLASEAEPAWPMGSYSQVSGALIFRFQIRDRDFLSFFICLCSELQPHEQPVVDHDQDVLLVVHRDQDVLERELPT
jgi:hypothetical protein